MPKCIAKFTITISNPNGDALDDQSEQYKEWHESGGGVVGNVRALQPYDYVVMSPTKIGVADDVYLKGTSNWSNRENALMGMTPECFEKYFVPVE